MGDIIPYSSNIPKFPVSIVHSNLATKFKTVHSVVNYHARLPFQLISSDSCVHSVRYVRYSINNASDEKNYVIIPFQSKGTIVTFRNGKKIKRPTLNNMK